MPVLQDISFNSSTGRRSGRKSMLVLGSDTEDEEDYDTAINRKSDSRKSMVHMGSDSEDSDSSGGYLSPLDHDKENEMNGSSRDHRRNRNTDPKRKNHPDSVKKGQGRPSATGVFGGGGVNSKKTPNPKPKKRRRRSSARFLRLSGRFGDEENGNEAPEAEQLQKLNDMYSKAIQLNAANKINAVNSWGLNIIDKMDKFLGDDDVEEAPIDVEEEEEPSAATDVDANNKKTTKKRVNFTKASCTIDACVKIYSYRVDDAHLTSYKVLANLNRTDGGNQKGKDDLVNEDNNDMDDERDSQRPTARRQSTAVVKTVETNMAALNISKLDSAYDIDPIFHKLSQKFDEGGAKGLLLVNLGVASDGCRIVLDSKENVADDSDEPNLVEEEGSVVEGAGESPREGMIDISNLVRTLESKMPSTPMENIHFVPQLEELRQTYAELEEEGFVEAGKAMRSKSVRYANNAEEDKAAEDEIHREALERSTASGIQQRASSFMMPNTSLMTHNVSMMGPSQNNNDDYQEDDYGGGDNDYDDEDDGAFENFVAMDDHAEKYASDSFRNDLTQDGFVDRTASISTIENSGPTTFLDEICASDALTQGTDFNYFNPELIEKLTSGNQWAGSAHWKKSQSLRPKKIPKKTDVGKAPKKSKQKRKSTKESNKKQLVDLTLDSYDECLKSLLGTKNKGAKKDQCTMTKATKQKCGRDRNLLPFDAGMTAKHFTEFFMRPGASLSLTEGAGTSAAESNKTVGFLGVETDQYGPAEFDDGIDDSYVDGFGFDIADHGGDDDNHTDDYAIQELEGIRKVEKVRVSHATVAKKVDVKRLKKDLWVELEKETTATGTTCDEQGGEMIDDTPNEKVQRESFSSCEKTVSFKETVKKLGATEAQEDVSLPFYFICVLHLANEKGLKLENGEHGLKDFVISKDSSVIAMNH